eukprot:TRINITY_DN38313_c0_g1_i1.p1 TRINITY_DN38313_c0_g1~~TRINITY_DN38313_c0_g1_i1.p1  ORF type:complete len:275 (-),score=66.44 TRINITY_DN38313_c0_g1_i1:43-867(-)
MHAMSTVSHRSASSSRGRGPFNLLSSVVSLAAVVALCWLPARLNFLGVRRSAHSPAAGSMEDSATTVHESALYGRRGLLAAGATVPLASGASADALQLAGTEEQWEILQGLAKKSKPLLEVFRSGRPVVVDFIASWCGQCLAGAEKLKSLEEKYGKDVDFVVMDVTFLQKVSGDPPPFDPINNWWAAEFRVSALPHTAFIGPDGDVKTALLGKFKQEQVVANVEAIRDNAKEMPYEMFDAFKGVYRRRKLQPPPPGQEKKTRPGFLSATPAAAS